MPGSQPLVRRSIRCGIALVGLLGPMAAAETVAVWGQGAGRLDGIVAQPAAAVQIGQLITAQGEAARLELIGFPGSDIILGSGAAVRLLLDTTSDRTGPRLIVQVEHGAVAFDIAGSGPYAALIARGGALESRAAGSEFILERGADSDYIALAKGLLLVRLRDDLAAADGMAIQLQARQGLAGSAEGLSEVDQLNRRPQLGTSQPIQIQAAGTSDDGDWSRDDAATATADPPADGTLTRAPVVAIVTAEPEVAILDKRPLPVPEPEPVVAPPPPPPVVSEVPPEPIAAPITAPLAACPPPVATPAPRPATAPDTAAMISDRRAAAGVRGAAAFRR